MSYADAQAVLAGCSDSITTFTCSDQQPLRVTIFASYHILSLIKPMLEQHVVGFALYSSV